MVTTDKVYRNHDSHYPYREDDALGGYDPYSASKAASELVIASYRDAFLAKQGVALASARAGNVIGGGDWSEDRLIPDAVRAWQGGRPLNVRCPQSVRPWQHVLEALAGYLCLAERLTDQPGLAGAFNFGPATNQAAIVSEVIELARSAYGRGEVCFSPEKEAPHEAGQLVLDASKACVELGVKPCWPLGEAIRRTMRWYRDLADGIAARLLCETDIAAYEESS